MNDETIAKICAVLERSDIVWSKYGSETIRELATKIYLALDKDEE